MDDEKEVHKKKRKRGGHVTGSKSRPRLDKAARGMACGGMKSGGSHWIQGAIKHPGALHKELGVPQGEKIPAKKLSKAANSDNPTLAERAHLAETLKKLH